MAAKDTAAEVADRAEMRDDLHDRLLAGLESVNPTRHVSDVESEDWPRRRWILARPEHTHRQVHFEFRGDGYIYVCQLSDHFGDETGADAPVEQIDPLQVGHAEEALKRVL